MPINEQPLTTGFPGKTATAALPTERLQLARQLRGYVRDTLNLNPAQAEACWQPNSGKGLQVLAGAGTGKTMLITARFLAGLANLLEQDTASFAESRILVLTFTEKAAAEMQERIHKHLLAAGYRGGLPRQTITTFHSFCKQLVERHVLELGYLPNIELLQGQALEAYKQALLRQIADGHLPSISSSLQAFDLDKQLPANSLSLETLNAWPAVKKMDWLESLAQQLEQVKAAGLSPRAFWETAHRQSQGWQEALLTLPKNNPYSGESIQSKEELAALWGKHLAPWASEDWLKTVLSPGLPYSEYKEALKDNVLYNSMLLNKRGSRMDRVVLEADWEPYYQHLQLQGRMEGQLIDALAAFYAVYQQQLQLANQCDFNDLINLSVTLLSNNPELREHYRSWFDLVLVDEFQDTNASQLALLQALCRPAEASNLMVVGDTKQSIYGFRHAQSENLDLILEGRPRQTVALRQNYRSLPPVVAVANAIADSLTTSDPLQQLIAVRTLPDDGIMPGVTIYSLGEYQANDSTGTLKRESIARIRRKQAYLITQQIAQALLHGTRPSEIAVLVRSHQRTELLAHTLGQLGLPYIKSQDASFFKEVIVIRAWCWLRLLANPVDRYAWTALLQALASPTLLQRFWQLYPKRDKNALQDAIAQWASWLEQPEQAPSFLPQTVLQYLALHARQLLLYRQNNTISLPLTEAIKQSMEGLSWSSAGSSEAEQRQDSITLLQWQLLLQTGQKQLGSDANLADLLAWVEAQQQDPDFSAPLLPLAQEAPLEAVRLLTVHASKGLEFPLVFVCWTEEDRARNEDSVFTLDFQFGNRPGFGLLLNKTPEGTDSLKSAVAKQIWKKPRARSETERIFYVALTRARDQLVLFRLADDPSKPDKDVTYTLPLLPGTASDVLAKQGIAHYNEADPEVALQLAKDLQVWQNSQWLEEKRLALVQRLAPLRATIAFASDNHAFIADISQECINLAQKLTSLPATSRPFTEKNWPTLSFSRLRQFSECPVSYWFQHQLGLPAPQEGQLLIRSASPVPELRNHQPEKPQVAALVGQGIHRLIEAHYQTQGQLSGTQTEALLLEAIAEIAQVPAYQQLAAEGKAAILSAFRHFEASPYAWKALQERGMAVIAPEVKSFYKLTLPHPVTSGIDTEVLLVGQLDALFFNAKTERYTLVDFKSNRQLDADKQALYFQQLALYRAALQQNNPGISIDNDDLILVHVTPEASVRSYQPDTTVSAVLQESVWQQWLRDQVNPILLQHSLAVMPSAYKQAPCQRCAYFALCPQAKAN